MGSGNGTLSEGESLSTSLQEAALEGSTIYRLLVVQGMRLPRQEAVLAVQTELARLQEAQRAQLAASRALASLQDKLASIQLSEDQLASIGPQALPDGLRFDLPSYIPGAP